MADGILKADKDYTKDVDRVLPEAEQLAKVFQSFAVIDHLLTS